MHIAGIFHWLSAWFELCSAQAKKPAWGTSHAIQLPTIDRGRRDFRYNSVQLKREKDWLSGS